MTVHDDLATLRELDRGSRLGQAAHRVEAEIARLEGYHDEEQRLAAEMRQERDEALELLQAAEAEVARLRDGLRQAVAAYDAIDEGTKIDSRMGYGLPGDSATSIALALHADPVFATVRALLADQDGAAYCTCLEGADGNPCEVCGKPEAVSSGAAWDERCAKCGLPRDSHPGRLFCPAPGGAA